MMGLGTLKIKKDVEVIEIGDTTTYIRVLDSIKNTNEKVLQIVSITNPQEDDKESVMTELLLEYIEENDTSTAFGFGGLVSLELSIECLKGVSNKTKDILKHFLNSVIKNGVSINKASNGLELIEQNELLRHKIGDYLIGLGGVRSEEVTSGLVTEGNKFIIYQIIKSEDGKPVFNMTVKDVNVSHFGMYEESDINFEDLMYEMGILEK